MSILHKSFSYSYFEWWLLHHSVPDAVDDGMEVTGRRRNQPHSAKDTTAEKRATGCLPMPVGKLALISCRSDELYEAPLRRMPLHTTRRTGQEVLHHGGCIEVAWRQQV